MVIGIDLGTTFCCMAYIAEDGEAKVITNSDGDVTTPSVLWFDGRNAYIGQKANVRKQVSSQPVYEFIKKNMGKPTSDPAATYEIHGYAWGAAGMAALVLRKLKKDAVRHLKRIGHIPEGTDEKEMDLDAIITVPAHFGDAARQETDLAGHAAGLNVIGIINEPTAAALTYGLSSEQHDLRRILVFDLGGGTCDVTVLEMHGAQAHVLASGGNSEVGGKDWDLLIHEEIENRFRAATLSDLPADRYFEIQRLAIDAKHELTAKSEIVITIPLGDRDLDVKLVRGGMLARRPSLSVAIAEASMGSFDFENASRDLLLRCEVICRSILDEARIESPSGRRPMEWKDLDDVVLAGGASRMPMIRAMLERISGRPVRQQPSGFDPDTAIAIGAALYGHNRRNVLDVVPKTVGICVERNGVNRVEPLVHKNTRVPTQTTRVYDSPAHALLEVYEGESTAVADCDLRGSLALQNREGKVTVTLTVNEDGRTIATAEQRPDPPRTLTIMNNALRSGDRARELRERVQAVTIW